MCVTTHLAIVNSGSLDSREQIRHDAVKQRQILRGQLGNVHVLHGQKQNLMKQITTVLFTDCNHTANCT